LGLPAPSASAFFKTYSARTTAGSVLSAVHSRTGSAAITCAPAYGKKSVTPTRRPTPASLDFRSCGEGNTRSHQRYGDEAPSRSRMKLPPIYVRERQTPGKRKGQQRAAGKSGQQHSQPWEICKTSIPGSNPGGASNPKRSIPVTWVTPLGQTDSRSARDGTSRRRSIRDRSA